MCKIVSIACFSTFEMFLGGVQSWGMYESLVRAWVWYSAVPAEGAILAVAIERVALM